VPGDFDPAFMDDQVRGVQMARTYRPTSRTGTESGFVRTGT
jgi:hypothetical protein